ncbi:disulfide bond formation protein B [Rhodobacterales bacterium HKCCSP123]|nr:disulfide bond formation protein B [Rhodobacterales bacterium HKCCSP123]
MTRRHLIALAGLGSLAVLLGAFGFQYIGGLAPCAMCLWQRWPHAAAIAIGALGAALPHAAIAALGALSMAVNAGIALLHTGVERGWWTLNLSCTGGSEDLGSMSMADLLNPEIGSGIVMCDEVAWEMFGLSMASWNGIACLVLMGIWIAAARARAAA